MTLRTRYNVFGDDGGKAAFTLIPFLALPGGDPHFGNSRVEGGLIAPLGVSLPYDFTLILPQPRGAGRQGRDRHRATLLTATTQGDATVTAAGRATFATIAALLVAGPALASVADISPALQRRAVRACRNDAMRLCPGHMSSRRAAARCIAAHRPKLDPACRRASDAVAHALKH